MKKEDYIIKNTLKLTNEADKRLSIYATKNCESIKLKDTLNSDSEFDIRWPFEEDIDRVLYCKSYRRYADKTQALSFFKNSHISKRSIHVQWVSRIARQIGRGLNLNLDLIEAIALGHDLGHAPFGHVGEHALNNIMMEKSAGCFCHNANSVRNIFFLEREGTGYNVSLQVLDGILCHNGELLTQKYELDKSKTISQFWDEYYKCWKKVGTSNIIKPMTLEGCVVRVSDVISYIGKDLEDAIKVGVINKEDIPQVATAVLGGDNKSIINKLIGDLVINSYQKGYLEFSDEVFNALKELMSFLSKRVHQHPLLVEENRKLTRMIKELFDVYYNDLKDETKQNSGIQKYVARMGDFYNETDPALIVCDYLSAMTDTYVLKEYENIFLPKLHDEII